MDINDALEISDVIGSRGTYQTLAALSLFFGVISNAAIISYIQFLAPKVTIYWNWDKESPNRTNFDSNNCEMEKIKQLGDSFTNFTGTPKLIYKSEYSKNTLTEKFDMVCENSWMVSFTKSLNSISVFAAGTVFRLLVKKYGIRMPFSLLTIVAVLANFGMLFAWKYIIFAISYMIVSASSFVMITMFLTLYSEIVPRTRRSQTNILLIISSVSGCSICAAVSWISKNWFYTQLLVTVFFIFLIPISWYILESPTWLIGKGRRGEANENLLKMAKRNSYLNEDTETLADVFLAQIEEKLETCRMMNNLTRNNEERCQRGTISDLFKNKVIASYTVSLIIVTSFANVCSSSVLLNVEAFGASLYVDFFILQGTCILLLPVTYFGARLSSRKCLHVILLSATGIVSLLYTFFHVYPAGRTAIPIATRAILLQVIEFNGAYVSEVFPNSVRFIGKSLVFNGNRMFLCFAPFMKDIGERTAVYVPFIMFSCMTLIGAITFYFLPNTQNNYLAHTVDDLIQKEPEEIKTSVFTISRKL